MTFAEAVKRQMLQQGMNATELSERSGVSNPYISKLFSGKVKEPTWAKACALIDALEMTPDQFREYMEAEHE